MFADLPDLSTTPLPRAFYDRPPQLVAPDLLGRVLVRRTDGRLTAGRIVEAEAYLAQDDPASHSCRGLKRRNASMFGPPGHAYVYAIHSRWCMNVVTQPPGTGSAVLLRAVEPLAGIRIMLERRLARQARDAEARARRVRGGPPLRRLSPATIQRQGFSPPHPGHLPIAVRELARGPARLCEAFAIDRELDGWDLTRPRRLWILAGTPVAASEIAVGVRIGVTSGHERPLRFWIAGNAFVSGRRGPRAVVVNTRRSSPPAATPRTAQSTLPGGDITDVRSGVTDV